MTALPNRARKLAPKSNDCGHEASDRRDSKQYRDPVCLHHFSFFVGEKRKRQIDRQKGRKGEREKGRRGREEKKKESKKRLILSRIFTY